jgi:hypothetical protein
VDTRAIHIDNGEAEIIRAKREGSGHRELVNGMVNKFKEAVIPSSDDAAGGA